MCGRFIVSYSYDDLVRFMSKTFDIFDLDESIDVPRYNAAPGQQVISIISDGSKYRAGTLQWGFIPHFATNQNTGYKMINARVEGIESKASFRDSFIRSRCVILADGYYEWKKVGKTKQPYLIQLPGKELFFFAGLWSKYVSDTKEVIYSTTIITKQADEELADIHDRMPIILNEKQAKQWLNPSLKDQKELLSILHHVRDLDMTKIKVSEYVNKVSNDSVQCIEPFVENTLL
jgi:putative SOS response-associated peptidase YedK